MTDTDKRNGNEDMDDAMAYSKITSQLFANGNYVEAYNHYMQDPLGGANTEFKDTTLMQFAENMFWIRDIWGKPEFYRFAYDIIGQPGDFPATITPAINIWDRDRAILTALINQIGQREINKPFAVIHEGYGFIGTWLGEQKGFNLELNVTPFDWINAAQNLGFELIQRDKTHWIFDNQDFTSSKRYISPYGLSGFDGKKLNIPSHNISFGLDTFTSKFATAGDAAKAACYFAEAVNTDEIIPRPDLNKAFNAMNALHLNDDDEGLSPHWM